jgi:cbb3-type cytochrome oxidase subunit 3
MVAAMTRLFQEAVATVSALPDDVQDELAHMPSQLAGIAQPIYALTPEERADLAEAARGEFVTDEDVRALWAKYGR